MTPENLRRQHMSDEIDYEPAIQLEIEPGREITVGQSLLQNKSLNIVTDTSLSSHDAAVTIHQATDKSFVYDLVFCGKSVDGERTFTRLIMSEDAAGRFISLIKDTLKMRAEDEIDATGGAE